MSTLAIVVIAIAAVIVIALVASVLRRTRDRKLEDRRQIAAQHRDESTSRQLAADKEAAAADEQAAHARREAAEAEERSRAAERERETARAHGEHAARLDPDERADEADQGRSTAPRTPA